ncbi:6269_t:CDS:2, partial [Cetraspora pellucida]
MSSEITKIQTPNNMSFKLNTPDNMSFEINTSYNNMFFELTEDTTNELAEIEIVNNMSFAIAETEMSNNRLENPEITRETHLDQYNSNVVPLHNLGFMNVKCSHCGALHWKDEKVSGMVKKLIFSICCAKGKVHLQSLAPTPPNLLSLLTENNACAQNFRIKIRMYNSVFTFTSMGAKIDEQVTGTSSVYSFRIHREMYHQIGILLPENPACPKFYQIYLYDTDEQQLHRQ